jgi:hypothetical protein
MATNHVYIKHLSNAVRVILHAVTVELDGKNHVLDQLVYRCKLEGNDLTTQGVAKAKGRLNDLEAGLIGRIRSGEADYDMLSTMLYNVHREASTDISCSSFTSTYYYRVVDIIETILRRVADAADAGMLLAHFSIETGSIRRHRMNGSGRIQRAIRNLALDGYSDWYDIEELLRSNEYIQCADCSDWEYEDNTVVPYNGYDSVCRNCIDRSYVWSSYYDAHVYCEHSADALDRDGDTVTIHNEDDDFHYDDNEDMYVHCDYSPRNKLIRGYHTAKKNDDYRLIASDFTRRTNRFMGVELEVEVARGDSSDIVEAINDATNDGEVGRRVFFEEDGSLSNGFEMITQPMGLDMHADWWRWLEDKSLVRGLRSHDTSTCGLHVHVNKSALNNMQINKMSVFINHPDNAELIRKISRRYAVSYARILEKKLGRAHRVEGDGYDSRYEAFNITNRKTVEFRIFKGTIKYDSLMAALEFVNAVVSFTAPASPAGFNLTTPNFMQFIEQPAMRGDTKFLRKYLLGEQASAVTVPEAN